jgi:hypothetical protein
LPAQPTVSQAQVNGLQSQIDKIGQQYDQVTGQLAAVRRQAAREQARFNAARSSWPAPTRPRPRSSSPARGR